MRPDFRSVRGGQVRGNIGSIRGSRWHGGCDPPPVRRLLAAVLMIVSTRTALAAEAGYRADATSPATFLGVELDPANTSARVEDAQRHAFLGDVLSILARSPSPIAANTLRALRSGVAHLDTLDRLTVEDCVMLLTENPKPWAGIAAAGECGKAEEGLATVPAAVLERVSGFTNGDRIYVNPARSTRDMATTVVHEINHVANHSQDHYGTHAEILREEYRAYWVAQHFEDAGRPVGGAYLGWLKHWIVENYALDASPAELTDVPSGNLDNAPGLLSIAE